MMALNLGTEAILEAAQRYQREASPKVAMDFVREVRRALHRIRNTHYAEQNLSTDLRISEWSRAAFTAQHLPKLPH
jgi:hypothetical protein